MMSNLKRFGKKFGVAAVVAVLLAICVGVVRDTTASAAGGNISYGKITASRTVRCLVDVRVGDVKNSTYYAFLTDGNAAPPMNPSNRSPQGVAAGGSGAGVAATVADGATSLEFFYSADPSSHVADFSLSNLESGTSGHKEVVVIPACK